MTPAVQRSVWRQRTAAGEARALASDSDERGTRLANSDESSRHDAFCRGERSAEVGSPRRADCWQMVPEASTYGSVCGGFRGLP